MATTLRANDGRRELAVNSAERIAAGQALPGFLQIDADSHLAMVHVELPAKIVGLMTQVLDAVAKGELITVGSLPAELTTAVAADQLGVSRPTLMKWISEGKLPAHKAGTHTRVKTEDIIAFRRARLEAQREALDELRALDEEFGL